MKLKPFFATVSITLIATDVANTKSYQISTVQVELIG